MSETRKIAAILVADVVGYSRLAALLLAFLSPAARAGGAEYYGYDQGGSRFARSSDFLGDSDRRATGAKCREAESSKAGDHHRPGRGLWN